MVLVISRISAMALSALLLAGFAQQNLMAGGVGNAYAQSYTTYDSASAAVAANVDVQAKQRASALSLMVKNKGGAPIYSLEVYLAENEVKKFKAPAGWKAVESDSSWVTFATEARPIGEGMKKTFRITLIDRAPATLEWSALGRDGEEIASGEWAPAGMGMNSGRQEHEAEHFRSDPATKQQSYPERQQQQLVLSIFTDKESYRAGEDVTLYGKGEHGSVVTVAVYDASGKTIAKKEARQEDDGSFKLSVSLRESSRGAHVAQAFQEDRTAAVRFVVKGGENNDNDDDDGRRNAASYNNYRYPEIRVSTDKPEYWQGESVFIHGQAFPDAKVKIKVVNREGVLEFRDEVAATADGAFRAAYTLDAKAQAGERKVLAEVTFDGRAYGGGAAFKVMGEAASSNNSKTAPVPVVANAGPQVAVAADQEQYRPGSLVLVTAKTSSPGYVTIAVYAPDGSTAAKKEVETDRSGVVVFEHRLGSDAPAGLWTVLAVQESSQARDSFEVLKMES